MAAVRIALLLAAAAMACAVMRVQRPAMAAGVAMAAGAAVLAMLLPDLRDSAQALEAFADAAGLEDGAALVMRAAGVALIAEFAQQICEDAGETALAGRVELAVRVTLFAMAAPMLGELVSLVADALG